MKELKEAIQQGKLVIGKERTLKLLKKKKLGQIVIAKNCPHHIREDLQHYAKLFSIPCTQSTQSNEELGVLCKKPFAISVLGF